MHKSLLKLTRIQFKSVSWIHVWMYVRIPFHLKLEVHHLTIIHHVSHLEKKVKLSLVHKKCLDAPG